MENQRLHQLQTSVEEIKIRFGMPTAKKLDLEKCQRILERLNSFATECSECDQHLRSLENHLNELYQLSKPLEDKDYKTHSQTIDKISSHLVKEHKLVTTGLYVSIYMPLGTALGVVFGLLVFDNVGIGLPLGIALGMGIGAGLDADANKKGRTL